MCSETLGTFACCRNGSLEPGGIVMLCPRNSEFGRDEKGNRDYEQVE